MKSYWIKPTLTALAALSLTTNLSAQRHGPVAAAEQAKMLIPHNSKNNHATPNLLSSEH